MNTMLQKGIDLIKSFESLRLHAYLDTGGTPTIGWGHTEHVKLGDTITTEQAIELFNEDLAKRESAVKELVKVKITDNEYSALVSFVFNVGKEAFATSHLLKYLNAGLIEEASKQFLRWIYDNGKVINGLKRRRMAELNLFLGY